MAMDQKQLDLEEERLLKSIATTVLEMKAVKGQVRLRNKEIENRQALAREYDRIGREWNAQKGALKVQVEGLLECVDKFSGVAEAFLHSDGNMSDGESLSSGSTSSSTTVDGSSGIGKEAKRHEEDA